MEDATKGESPVEETPATEKPQVEVYDPRASIFEKYDKMKAEKAETEAEAPVEEKPEETPPPEKASGKPEKPEAEPVKDVIEELTPEEFKERFKNVKVKGKFAGEEAVVGADELLRIQGLDRHLTKRLQEVARKEEALGAAPPPPVEYRPTEPPPADKPLRYLGENEVAAKYDELFSESPYKATQFLNTVQSERQKAQAENEKTRMDTAEKDFLAIHSDMEPGDYEALKSSFSNADFFQRNPDVDAAFARRDYYGALELSYTKIERQKLSKEREAIKAAREAALAEEQKKIDLKKKGSVIRTASKPEGKPKEDWKPLTPSEAIAAEAERRRGLRNIK